MQIERLDEKVKEAKEAVKDLEEPLKTEAFKKILDKLLESPAQVQRPKASQPLDKRKKKKRSTSGNLGKAGVKAKEKSEKKKRELATKLNRSHYPDIYDLKKILPQALYVLNIMKKKEIGGLTPPEIRFILKEVFGINHSPESISVSLNRREAKKYTARKRIVIGRTVAYVYEIMKAGEDYLDKIKQ